MYSCDCGRGFASTEALAQHQNDKHKVSARTANSDGTTFPNPPRARHPRDRWMWQKARTTIALHVVSKTNLEPCVEPVTSEGGYELICTYNWQDSKDATIQVPGSAPILQLVALPITLPPDKGVYHIDQNAGRVPMYPFEPVFRAAEVMNPMLDCDDLDIVINRNSLRKLFNFLSGSLTDSFCVGLAMVHNTLFVERCERSARELIRGSRQSGWGHSFEKTSTRVVKEGDRSTQHHRILRYDLGHLSCLVRFEVDACYEEDPGDKEKMAAINTQDDLVLKLGKLSFGSTSNSDQNSSTHVHMAQRQFMPMPQSTAAEMKTSRQNVTKFLPQMWFGRTPWLIRGNHVEGTFDRVDILNIESKFQEWEIRNQAKLRSMVTLLSQLREAVKVNGSKRCIAIYGKGGQFEVFESTTQNNPLPDDLIRKFWGRAES